MFYLFKKNFLPSFMFMRYLLIARIVHQVYPASRNTSRSASSSRHIVWNENVRSCFRKEGYLNIVIGYAEFNNNKMLQATVVVLLFPFILLP